MNGTNTPSTAVLLDEPSKFLGLCSPAWSFCCGCTLQGCVRSLGVALTLFGFLRVVGALLTVELDDLIRGLVAIITGGGFLAAGLLFWSATIELCPKRSTWGLWIHGLSIVIGRAYGYATFIKALPYAYDRILGALVEAWRKQHVGETMPKDVLEELKSIAKEAVNFGVAEFVLFTFLLLGGFFFIEAYLVWSWIVRVKRQEYSVVLYGIQPIVLPLANGGAMARGMAPATTMATAPTTPLGLMAPFITSTTPNQQVVAPS